MTVSYRPFADHPLPFPDAPAWRAVCDRVVDGDTIRALVDIGFYCYRYMSLRLAGIDAPELFRGTAEERALGMESKSYLESLVAGQPLRVTTFRDRDSFGRFIARVERHGPDGWSDVGAAMVASGHAALTER